MSEPRRLALDLPHLRFQALAWGPVRATDAVPRRLPRYPLDLDISGHTSLNKASGSLHRSCVATRQPNSREMVTMVSVR